MILATSRSKDNLEQPHSASQFEELFKSPYPFHCLNVGATERPNSAHTDNRLTAQASVCLEK